MNNRPLVDQPMVVGLWGAQVKQHIIHFFHPKSWVGKELLSFSGKSSSDLHIHSSKQLFRGYFTSIPFTKYLMKHQKAMLYF